MQPETTIAISMRLQLIAPPLRQMTNSDQINNRAFVGRISREMCTSISLSFSNVQ
jgi:hypothetical protein